MTTYYDILDITHTATYKQVEIAYKNLIQKYNKNRSSNDEKYLKNINRAYYVLGGYHNRRKYDEYLEGLNKKSDLIGPNIDGIIKPFLRDVRLDNKMSDSFIKADNIFNEMQKQCLDKKKNTSNSFYIQSQNSKGQRLPNGQYQLNTAHYINDNGTESRKQGEYFYDEQGKLVHK
ncbi:hypothetical protein CPAV1605_694 [seawater metagenome]|uniref:J domain-containing protein n=1 Tax=seawater metagenome TaxID=1561972 RepID=A0A5E8CK02_9ZZZZ